MEQVLFYVVVGIIVIDFLAESILTYLNNSWRSKPIPVELEGIYDEKKYQTQQAYSKVNARFAWITSIFSFVLILCFLLFDGFAQVNTYLAQYLQNELLLGLAFFGVIYLAYDLISLPFDLYDTFVIEERFGFNKTTPKLYILDKLKGYLLSVLLGGGLYSIIYKVYIHTGDQFWLVTWGVMAFFMLFFTMFYSNLIVPLFNKQQPLSNTQLKSRIEEFSQKVGFKIQNIFEIDGSKRSTRANAYFTGFGPKKRIVLYDTLVQDLSHDEIVAVLAHEIGHYKHKHTLSGMLIGIVQMGVMLYILSLFISNPLLSNALGVETPTFHISLIAFALLYSPISTIISLFMNVISRKNEYQADAFVKENYQPEYLITALKKLSVNNLSNLTPHPVYVWVNYSHPTLFQRIKSLTK